MALDRNAFINNFLEEAAENLSAMESGILVLKNDPENQTALTSFLRELHTLKGSARMLKFPCLEKITHGLEDVFKGVKEGRYGITHPLVHLVLVACDHVRGALRQIRASKDDTVSIERLLDCYAKACANEPFNLEWHDPQAGDTPGTQAAAALQATAPGPSAGPSPGPSASAASKPAGEERPAPEAGNDSIRVHTGKIDELLRLHNDLIIKQFQLKKEQEALGQLETAFRGMAEARSADQDLRQVLTGLSLLAETRKRFAGRFSVMERSAQQVQKGLLNLLMLPADLILGPLPAMVEATAASLGKEVDLVLSGNDLGLDRVILEHLRDPVIHLVRNALDHGIETPAERTGAGKPSRGSLQILCSTDSGSFIMRIRDDGRGLDYGRIRAKAKQRRPELADEIEAMPEQALTQFLFEPGFSTRDTASELSGRGLGLDIVRHGIEAVKGKITLSSTAGQGTEFTLVLPLSLATVSGFFVRLGTSRFLIPSNYIQEVVLIQAAEQINFLNRKAMVLRDKIVPVHYLGDLIRSQDGESPKKLTGLVVEYLGETLGISVDGIDQYVSLVFKTLPPSLGRLRALQGFVFDENFDIIPILSVPELIEKFKRSGNYEGMKRFSQDRPEYKRLLVVDDSFSTREIEKSILEFEGYTVETAVDGIEALEMLKTRNFHLVVTDLNMPRMDGVTLVQNLKRDERYRDIPVIVVSSEKDAVKRKTLAGLGATSFLDKADFDRGDLAQEVHRLLSGAQASRQEGTP